VIRNSESLVVGKVDQHFDPEDSLFVHYSLFNENRFNPFDPVNSFTSLPGYGSFTLNNGQNAGLAWTHIFSSRAINEFRLGVNRMRAGALHLTAAQIGA